MFTRTEVYTRTVGIYGLRLVWQPPKLTRVKLTEPDYPDRATVPSELSAAGVAGKDTWADCRNNMGRYYIFMQTCR